jgi:hypothetical protein
MVSPEFGWKKIIEAVFHHTKNRDSRRYGVMADQILALLFARNSLAST